MDNDFIIRKLNSPKTLLDRFFIMKRNKDIKEKRLKDKDRLRQIVELTAPKTLLIDHLTLCATGVTCW